MSDYHEYDDYHDDEHDPLAEARARKRRKKLQRLVFSIVGGVLTIIFISVPLVQALSGGEERQPSIPTLTPDAAPAVLFQQAVQAAANNDHSQAIALLTRALAQDPQRAQLYAQRGQSYAALGNNLAARADYQTYAAITGNVESYMAPLLSPTEE